MYQTRHLHYARWIVQIENSPPYFESQYTKLDINKFVFITQQLANALPLQKKESFLKTSVATNFLPQKLFSFFEDWRYKKYLLR